MISSSGTRQSRRRFTAQGMRCRITRCIRRRDLRRQQIPLLGYEKRLLDGLTDVGARSRLSALASEFGMALDDTREVLVREAVHQGWLRHLRRDQRTPKGDDLALQVRSFSRDLRLKAEGDKEALAGALLPYDLHFGLVSGDQTPLARFAHAWVRAGRRRGPSAQSLTTPLPPQRIRVISCCTRWGRPRSS
jgi:hypothetical protein